MEFPFFYSVDPWSAAGRRRVGRDMGSPFFHTADPRSVARERDMESPFFYSSDPRSVNRERDSESPFFYSADTRSAASRHRPTASPAPAGDPVEKPRVISIPVRFAGSEETPIAPAPAKPVRSPQSEAAKSSAAVAIQRVLRGHLVRKNVKIVSQVAIEAAEIERRVRAEEERLQADPKERLRVGEMLMALLFRLDSVRGVREYRKKVIRRVIALQEFLDSISAPGPTLESPNSVDSEAPIPAEKHPENRDPDVAFKEAQEMPQDDNFGDETIPDVNTEEASVGGRQEADSAAVEVAAPVESQNPILAVVEDAEERDRDLVSNASDEGFKTLEYTDDVKKEEEKEGDEGFVVVSMEEATDTTTEANSETVAEKAPVFDSVEQESREIPAEEAPEVVETKVEAGLPMAKDSAQAMAEPGAPEMEDVVKKVMAESERLQGLVAALCERSAQQCRLMAGLVERVEHLERAVQRMERKKKRSANCSLASPVDKKGSRTKQ